MVQGKSCLVPRREARESGEEKILDGLVVTAVGLTSVFTLPDLSFAIKALSVMRKSVCGNAGAFGPLTIADGRALGAAQDPEDPGEVG